eukprot:COSAG01_NODE_26257_length_719_cov_3.200000_1_plen_153_part_10
MRIIYCTDPGQSLHFEQVFQIARRAGWGSGASLEHVPFGLVMGEDGQKLKTRSGETPKLIDLLDTAVILANAKMLKMYRDELTKEGLDASRKEWLETRVQPYLDRLDGCVEALDRMEVEVEGEEAWFVARDELKQLLRGGATDPWLVSRAIPS